MKRNKNMQMCGVRDCIFLSMQQQEWQSDLNSSNTLLPRKWVSWHKFKKLRMHLSRPKILSLEFSIQMFYWNILWQIFLKWPVDEDYPSFRCLCTWHCSETIELHVWPPISLAQRTLFIKCVFCSIPFFEATDWDFAEFGMNVKHLITSFSLLS